MNRRALFLVVAAPIVFAAASRADETASPAAQPNVSSSSVSTPAAAAPIAAPAAAPAAAPSDAPSAVPATTSKEVPASASETNAEAKPAAKPEIKSAPETKAAPEAKAEEKPLSPCAAKFEPVLDAYQLAHDNMLAWLRSASGKMEAGDAKIADLKKLIAENEARITQLKLDAAQKSEAQARELDQQTRGLWTQLKAEESRQKDLCRALSSAAGRKVRELNASVLEQFEKSAQTP